MTTHARPSTDAPGILAGTSLLVTGGSRGIGRAIVRAAHREGATVVLHYSASVEPAEALREELGARVHLVHGDLTGPAGPEQVWRDAVDAVERVDALVNNAGAWIASPLASDDGGGASAWRQGWQANLALNLTAPADLCREAILHFSKRGGGTIINLASRSSHRGDDADHLAYGAAKGGILALTRGIARGYAKHGVLAYAVAPGWVDTGLAAGASPEDIAALPLGEITPPEDVAETVVFLASGRARHATGATIDITGADYVR